jgi:hypothetical protein
MVFDAFELRLGEVIQVLELQRCLLHNHHGCAVQQQLKNAAAGQINMHVIIIQKRPRPPQTCIGASCQNIALRQPHADKTFEKRTQLD